MVYAKCINYKIPCPYSMKSENAPVPCFGSQEECNVWREKYKKQVTDALSPKEASKLEAKLLG